MTQQTLNKSITRVAELMEVTVEQVRKDLKEKNPVRWYMIEEVAKSI